MEPYEVLSRVQQQLADSNRMHSKSVQLNEGALNCLQRQHWEPEALVAIIKRIVRLTDNQTVGLEELLLYLEADD